MGENHNKSGMGLPRLGGSGKSLTGLPKLGTLSRSSLPQKKAAVAKEAASVSDDLDKSTSQAFDSEENDRTEVVNADDVLAALNNKAVNNKIDEWDDVSFDSVPSHASGEQISLDSLEMPTISESSFEEASGDDGGERTIIGPPPSFLNRDAGGGSSGSIPKIPSSSQVSRIPSTTIPKISSSGPNVKIPAIPAPPSGVTPTIPAPPSGVTPAIPAPPSGVTPTIPAPPSGVTPTIPAPPSGVTPTIPAPPSGVTPEETEEDSAPDDGVGVSEDLAHQVEVSSPEGAECPDEVGVAASHGVEVPAEGVYEAPEEAPVDGQSDASAGEAGESMSEEEQLRAILESMTPEERAAYEVHCYEEQKKASEARRAHQRELLEMYGKPLVETRSFPKGLIVAIVAGVAAVLAVGYFLVNSQSGSEGETIAAEESVAAEEPVAVRAAPLATYPVRMDIAGASHIFVNGVEVPRGSSAHFVEGRMNSVMAYGDGMTPYFETFREKVDLISERLVPDSLYSKGRLVFRVTDPAQSKGMRASLDGRTLYGFPSQDVPEVVLGRPHILVVEKEGYAKHMHILWPDDIENTVTIPELKPAGAELRGTECMISTPKGQKAYGVRISTGGDTFESSVVVTPLPGDIVEYTVRREQRKSLRVAVVPDGFGTMRIDATLLKTSLGESVVSFKMPPGEDFRVCMRRVGVVECLSMTTENTVGSGMDWEFFAVQGPEDSPTMLRGIQSQELKSTYRYTFEPKVGVKGVFSMKTAALSRISSKGNK